MLDGVRKQIWALNFFIMSLDGWVLRNGKGFVLQTVGAGM